LCAGSVESILAIKAMETGILPKIKNLEEPCLDDLNFVMGENIKKEVKTMIKTCFGFGSNSAAMILRKL